MKAVSCSSPRTETLSVVAIAISNDDCLRSEGAMLAIKKEEAQKYDLGWT
jgi:hypothetical protein